MTDKVSNASLNDASENIRMAIMSIGSLSSELASDFSGKSFEVYKKILSEVNISLERIKSRIETMI